MNFPCTRLSLLLLVLLFGFNSFSQTDCGFDKQHKSLLLTNAAYKANIQALNLRLQKMSDQRRLSPNSPLATVYKIPVVVHVIHKGEAIGVGTNISEAQLQSAITSMTQFYRGTLGNSPDTEIEFELAKLSPTCAVTSGIVRIDGSSVPNYSTNGITTGGAGNETAVKNLSKWSNTDYYNIWIVSEIDNNNGGSGIQGFAYFPGASSAVDGAVIMYNSFGYDPTNTLGYNLKTYTDENKTLIHEMGHAFSLYHSFEGDDGNNDGVSDQCPANVTCLSEGDQVCDTDPHRRSLSNCPTGANVCGGMIDNIAKNFMDYSSAACQDRFTSGQISRMRDAIALDRPTLISSLALNNTYPASPFTPPLAASCTPTTGATGLSGNFAGIIQINITSRDFVSSTPPVDNVTTGYLNSATNCLSLIQMVRGGTYTFTATVLSANQEQLRAWIDYNNNGVFNNATEQIHFNSLIPNTSQYLTTSGNFTVPATATIGTMLRLRVIDDLIPGYPSAVSIASGCHNPVYGQAEDFPVLLSAGLPVVLEYFTAKKNGKDVLISWQTSLEQNAKEFQIEKSHDGVNFNKIGIVPATRNSSTTRQYSFIDRTISQENNYYRLKQVDMDDQFELSKIVLIKNPLNSRVPFTLLSNPIQNHLDIQFGNIGKGKVKMRLTDITGKVLLTWNNGNVENQRFRISVDKTLIKGVYILHAYVEGKEYVEKVIVK